MTTRRLGVRATAAVLAAVAALGLLAPTATGQTPPTTIAPSGEAPAGQVEVHSWALTPASAPGAPASATRPYFSYNLAPGGTVEDAVTLFNYGNVQLTFRIYATDANNNEDGAFDLLPGDQAPADAGSWVTIPQENITVPAQSQATVPITINIPADARPGDHAGAVLASSQAIGTGPDGKTVLTDRRTGSRLYIRVAGPLAPELTVEDISTEYTPGLNPAGGKTEISYRLVNRGNVRMSASHSASVAGILGLGRKRAAGDDIPELLPGESVTVTASLDGVPATGVVFTTVDLESAVIGEEGSPIIRSKRAMTLALPITVLAVLLAVGLALYARRAYLRHRRSEQHLSVGPQSL
ncbi:MAG: DUF916 domain-containing protein [Acidimicrobiia bacterium]